MKKAIMLVVAGLVSTSALAVDHTDPLGTGALESSDPGWVQVSKDYRAGSFSVNHADPIGTGALESGEIVYNISNEAGSTVSQPEIGDASSDDGIFDNYETSDVL